MPHRPPNSTMEKMIQKGFSPSVSPSTFGFRIFPSNCWSTTIKARKINAFQGSTITIRMALGIAPKYGPNTGIRLVTPTKRAIIAAYGI